MRGVEDYAGERPGRLRRYWQGVMIAAAVSYGQLQADIDVRVAELPPYVRMLPDQPPRFHPLEVVGGQVLTVPLEHPATLRSRKMRGECDG